MAQATAARRSGDDYQDLVALRCMVEMLAEAERYEWIRFESGRAGLDDIVRLRRDGSMDAIQVKHSKHAGEPANELGWDELVRQPEGRRGTKLSLLQKWARAWDSLPEGAKAVPIVVSNRSPTQELRHALTPAGHLSRDRVPQAVKRQIENSLTSDQSEIFLNSFWLRLDHPNIEELEASVSSQFFRLGGQELSWLQLKESVRAWIRSGGHTITIQDIQTAAGWESLRELRQDFVVPADYVLPTRELLDVIEDRAKVGEFSVTVLSGEPGAGKSTYLSWAYRTLVNAGLPVVRHHYSISSELQPWERFDPVRVAESLIASLKNSYEDSLGPLAHHNLLAPESLGLVLSEVANHFASRGQSLTVIVDGLDHVWRERDSRVDLDQLFEVLLLPREGLSLVVGTQPVDDARLPRKLIQVAPRGGWFSVPRLTEAQIAEWVEIQFQEGRFRGPRLQTRQEAALVEALHDVTGGHPLHLKYVWLDIFEKGLSPSATTVRSATHSAPGPITHYYSGLWEGIGEAGRSLLHLVASTDLVLEEGELLACLREAGFSLLEAEAGLSQTRHLFIPSARGLRAVHGSMLTFVRAHPNHASRKQLLLVATVRWLETGAGAYLRESHLFRLKAALGDSEPLATQANRSWAIDVLSLGLPPDRVFRTLRSSALVSLSRGGFPRFVKAGLASDYLSWALDGDETLAVLLETRLVLGDADEVLDERGDDLAALGDKELLVLSKQATRNRDEDLARRCLDEANLRLQHQEARRGRSVDWRDRYGVVVEVAACAGASPRAVRRFISGFEERGETLRLLKRWADQVARLGQVSVLAEYLHLQVKADERSVVGQAAASVHAIHGSTPLGSLSAKLPSIERSYLASRGLLVQTGAAAPRRPRLLRTATKWDYDAKPRSLRRYFREAFVWHLVSKGNRTGVPHRLGAGDDTRIDEATDVLSVVADRVNGRWAAGTPLTVSDLFADVAAFEASPPSIDFAGREVSGSLRAALLDLCLELVFNDQNLSRCRDRGIAAWETDDESALISILRALSNEEPGRVASDVALGIWSNALRFTQVRPRTYSELADTHAAGALLLAKSSCHGESLVAMRAAFACVLSYGWHKDILLDQALVCAENAWDAGVPEAALDAVLRIAPLIASVGEFTDGDETGHLPELLGKVMCRVSKERLPRYLLWLNATEQYRTVEKVLATWLASAEFDRPEVRALAATCIEPEQLRAIGSRAHSHTEPNAILNLSPRFASGSAERPESPSPDYATSNSARQDERSMGPQAEDFPPGSLDEFLVAQPDLGHRGRGELICDWASHWADSPRAIEAVREAIAKLRADETLGVAKGFYSLVTSTLGPNAAFEWLGRAQRTDYGWSPFYSEGATLDRWKIVREQHADRWLDFIVQSFEGRFLREYPQLGIAGSIHRLSRYLWFVGRSAESLELLEGVTAALEDVTSAQSLPRPAWLSD